MIKKKDRKNSKSFKIVILALAICLLSSLFYIYRVSERSKNEIVDLRKKNKAFEDEKMLILSNLKKSELMLATALRSKSEITNELLAEREKVKKLITDLQNSKSDKVQLLDQFKKGADLADARIISLMKQLDEYKIKVDSTTAVLNKERKINDTLKIAQTKLKNKINEAAKLTYYNFVTKSYKLKNSGKEIETDKASRVDFVKIMFIIGENSLIKSLDKTYYIQIIDSKNNVIGEKNSENFGNVILTYSALKKVKYESKSLPLEFKIPVANLEEGSYFVNVFDKTKSVLNTTFTLK